MIEESNVPRGTLVKFEKYCSELIKWNKVINLVSRHNGDSLEFLMSRHVQDCLQICSFIDVAGKVLDIGSGAGFPGMVLAIMGFENISMIDSDNKKCSFLRHISAELGVKCNIYPERIENHSLLYKGFYDVVTSRAFAPCIKIIDLCKGALRDTGKIILLKSVKQLEKEINEVKHKYIFDLQMYDSRVSNEGRVVIFSNIKQK